MCEDSGQNAPNSTAHQMSRKSQLLNVMGSLLFETTTALHDTTSCLRVLIGRVSGSTS